MDIVGHTRQMEQLSHDLESGNVSHAYLFVGPQHIGKFTVAKWFAKKLLLKDVPDDQKKQTEHMIEKLLHSDLLVLDQLWIEEQCEDWNVIANFSNVSQEHRQKSGARTDKISIDDIRSIQDRIMDTGIGTYRCICISDIARMDDPPANALLKMLEEPPEGRVFLLTAESTADLLPTVVSRCRVIQFSPVSAEEVQPMLASMDPEEAPFLFHVSQGSPGLVQAFLDDSDRLRQERLWHTQASSFWQSRTLSERLKLLEPLHARSQEADRFLLHLALTLRERRPLKQQSERALRALSGALRTNTNRPLLATQFAMSVE